MKTKKKSSKPVKGAMNYSRFGQYEDAIKSKAFKKALTQSIKSNPDRTQCKAGHDLLNPKAGHIHVGDLMRTGYRTCRTCWKASQAAYENKLAKAAKTAKKEAK